MRRGRAVLPVLPVLLLLCPVPGRGGGCGSGRTTAAGGCCTPCPPGFGVTEPCGHTDTRCQPCTHNRTFSAVSSAVEPCQPCTPCPLLPARPCTPARDTLCTHEDLERTGGEPVTGDPSPVTPEFVPPPPEATGKDIIPVYCSLLAAVVVGLLAYVAFKCWHTCRQKQQLAKARAGDLGTSPEGEKLHSDSGVFLDTHSLQEPHQPGKAPRPEGHPFSTVPAQRQEELERLLESGGSRGGTGAAWPPAWVSAPMPSAPSAGAEHPLAPCSAPGPAPRGPRWRPSARLWWPSDGRMRPGAWQDRGMPRPPCDRPGVPETWGTPGGLGGCSPVFGFFFLSDSSLGCF